MQILNKCIEAESRASCPWCPIYGASKEETSSSAGLMADKWFTESSLCHSLGWHWRRSWRQFDNVLKVYSAWPSVNGRSRSFDTDSGHEASDLSRKDCQKVLNSSGIFVVNKDNYEIAWSSVWILISWKRIFFICFTQPHRKLQKWTTATVCQAWHQNSHGDLSWSSWLAWCKIAFHLI